MNKVARMIVMSGMAAAAALAFSAGPAAASSATPATPAPTASKATTESADRFGPSRSKVVNYFRDPRTCNRVGWIGERRNQWDSYNCFRVPFGFKRGWWALQVRWDNHGGFPGHHGGPIGFPGHHGGPIGFPGHHGGPIGFPGHQGPHFPAKK
ncbi:hypothetical protein [Paractinoplanes toevensis]|uniref:Uncharacterized protein n=1 Tax=Paractinoplanes toevensis TaxID=571911 RepID=A0A920BNR8_9ACTN|nr:hypothetical protein [Actinoplanes toevensis]GIM95773.1 hypothetical protein Ato02nite_075660 [Actinoplanes toevensis]